jgi:UDP-glucose 4-epimerase
MNAAVFGGSGFLGSHVADELSARGYKVYIYDLRPSAYIRKNQAMVVGDVLDDKMVDDIVKKCDIVYNFSAIADIGKACLAPLKTIKTNIIGNSIILDACRKTEIKRFVYASSLYVYSKFGSFYRSTKQASELLIENYSEIFGLPYTILRYGSLYGPRAGEENFIYGIIKQAFTENKISRFGDGEELREYIHVVDAAKGSVEILEKEFENQNVTLTGNQQIMIKDLLFMIKEMLDKKIKIKYLPPRKNNHYEITPYTFSPKTGKRLISRTCVDLQQGLFELIREFYEKNNSSQFYHGTKMKSK